MPALARRLLIVFAFTCGSACAQEARLPEGPCDHTVPIPEDERQQITKDLLVQHPLLASSPGVKAAEMTPPGCPYHSTMSVVIFYPHSEQHGIKEAYEANCGREFGVKTWTCEPATIRRYLQLSSQHYEVRLLGDIPPQAALAAIEASQRSLHESAMSARLPSTVLTMRADEDGGYFITRGTLDGTKKFTMRAELRPDGDSANAEDWQVTILRRR